MNAGDLIEQITIQAESRSANGQGGYTTSWANVGTDATPWANVRMLSGDEALQAGVQRAVQQWRVVLRYRTDLTAKHRIVWNGLNLNIKAVGPLPEQPREYTLAVCESGAVV